MSIIILWQCTGCKKHKQAQIRKPATLKEGKNVVALINTTSRFIKTQKNFQNGKVLKRIQKENELK